MYEVNMDNKEFLERDAKSFNERAGNLSYVDCPICKNKGLVAKVVWSDLYNEWIEVMSECECKQQRNTIKKAHNSGLGNYLEKRFTDYETTEEWQKAVKEKAIDYCKNANNEWFIICGQSGSGKTLICSIIANYLLLKKDKTVRYITWTDFISKVKRDMMDDQTDVVSRYLEDVKRVEVLYIDELLKKYNETDLKYIIEIINYRYSNGLQTIITSERDISNLLDIDEATFGRVIERSGKYVTNIAQDRTKNYRLRGI